MTEPDAILVRRALARDAAGREAFGVLVARHAPLLRATCRRMAGGDDGLADDAAQEAVLQAFVGLPRLRDPAAFGPWLAGIGLRVARRLRARGARGPLAGGALADEAAPDPADDAERRADAQRVWAAVAALPEGQRDAVVLHYLAGLSQAEVAAHLQTAEGAIRNRLYKARAALREQLTESPQEVPVVSDHVPVRIASIGRSEEERWSATHVVVLEETRGARRRLPIWIDTAEATALAAALESVELPRPGTYMLTSALLQAVGRAVREVRIERLDADIFYAVVVLDDGASVDARPSDALNLAVVAGAPITVAETVLEAADEPEPALSEDTAAIAETVRRRLMRAT